MDSSLFLSYFLILLLLIPNAFCALLPLRDHLRFPIRKTAVISLACIAAVIVSFAFIGALTGITAKWLFALALAPALVVHLFLTVSDMSRRLFCFFNATMISGNSLLYGFIVAAPFEPDDSFATLAHATCLSCLAVMLVLCAIYYRTLSVKIRFLITSEALDFDYKLATPITMAITALMFWVTPRYVSVVMTGRVRITILAFLALAPMAFVLMYHSMWRVAVNVTENAALRESNELMELEQKRYRELRQYMDETRDLRHDFRQHLLVMEGYAKSGDTEKLTDYIGQFTGQLAEYRGHLAANPALDAVATHYDAMAEGQHTHVKWMIDLPAELPLRESDLITIFGNLVENALIAVRGLPEEERSVHVIARMLSDAMLGLTVRNPYAGEIRFNKKGLPRSDKAGHGIGLSSVSAVVSRYSGTLDISTDDSVFTASVLLYLQSVSAV